MARMTIQLSDELDMKFRLRVLKMKGATKGALGKAVSEALDLWLKAHPEEELETSKKQ